MTNITVFQYVELSPGSSFLACQAGRSCFYSLCIMTFIFDNSYHTRKVKHIYVQIYRVHSLCHMVSNRQGNELYPSTVIRGSSPILSPSPQALRAAPPPGLGGAGGPPHPKGPSGAGGPRPLCGRTPSPRPLCMLRVILFATRVLTQLFCAEPMGIFLNVQGAPVPGFVTTNLGVKLDRSFR